MEKVPKPNLDRLRESLGIEKKSQESEIEELTPEERKEITLENGSIDLNKLREVQIRKKGKR
ncbi:MAG TPA: hypothetical protein VJH94_03315 [Candidatus Paceibacterota bacterium]